MPVLPLEDCLDLLSLVFGVARGGFFLDMAGFCSMEPRISLSGSWLLSCTVLRLSSNPSCTLCKYLPITKAAHSLSVALAHFHCLTSHVHLFISWPLSHCRYLTVTSLPWLYTLLTLWLWLYAVRAFNRQRCDLYCYGEPTKCKSGNKYPAIYTVCSSQTTEMCYFNNQRWFTLLFGLQNLWQGNYLTIFVWKFVRHTNHAFSTAADGD